VSHGQLGTLAIIERNLEEAAERYGAALALFRQLGEPAMEAVTLHQLGLVFQEMEQWEESELYYREAARIKEERGLIGGANGVVSTWSQLAVLCDLAGKTTAAENWYRKAIEAGRRHETPKGLAISLANLARLLARQPEQLGEARELAEEALSIGRTLDSSAELMWSIYNVLVYIADRDSRFTKAREYRRLAREAKRGFAGTQYDLRRHAGLLQAVVAACLGQEEALTSVAVHQRSMRVSGEGWSRVADAIEGLLAGERDVDSLCANLHLDGAMIIETILHALEDPSALDDLLGDSEPA
jgi:tetratricopeptide (TPR) repeat protein